MYLAAGSNENKCLLYDARGVHFKLINSLVHDAAVKAIAWSPHNENLLVTGGGTKDRKIKLWNVISISTK